MPRSGKKAGKVPDYLGIHIITAGKNADLFGACRATTRRIAFVDVTLGRANPQNAVFQNAPKIADTYIFPK